MIETQLSASKESYLINALNPNNNLTTKRYEPNYNWESNIIKQIDTIDPQINDNIFIFQLPKTGFLINLVIESELTRDQDNRLINNNIGIHLFKDIYLKQGTKIIQHLTSEYLISRIDDEQVEKRDALLHLINPNIDFNNNTIKVYTPLY